MQSLWMTGGQKNTAVKVYVVNETHFKTVKEAGVL